MRRNRGNTEFNTGARRARRGLAFGAVVGAIALLAAACGNSSTNTSTGSKSPAKSAKVAGLYGHLPSAGTPSNGGTISIGELTGSTPEYILPITPENLSSIYNDFEFQDIMWLPLYWSPEGSDVTVDNSLSIADPPKFSNGNKTVTIQMKPGYKWSTNGAPVDANDVIFFIDLVKQAVKESPSNWNNYSPGYLPDNLASATATGKYTVTLKLTKAYNPGYFYDDQLDLLEALPSTDWNVDSTGGAHLTDWSNPAVAKQIYDYLNTQSKDLSTFASNPLWQDVDGPFRLTSFNATNGAYTQVPNPSYGGPQKARFSVLKAEPFTSDSALFNQIKAGTVDFAGWNGSIDPSAIPEFNSVSGYTFFGLPDFGFQAAFYNFDNTVNHFNKVIGQLYIRQVLAHLEDQPGWVKAKGLLDGAGGVDYGPIPATPSSPYAPKNATQTPYPYSISAAKKLLTSHGWHVRPGGLTTCAKGGAGAGHCGAGIPTGTPLSFSWQYANVPPLTKNLSVAYASACLQVGIKLHLTVKTFDYLIQNDNNPAAKSNINKWQIVDFGGFTQSLYPTTNTIFNTSGDYNLGSYSSPEANAKILASISGSNPNAVTAEASYLTSNQPALFMPNPDVLTAVKNTIGGTTDSFLNTTQDTFTPQYWYIKK